MIRRWLIRGAVTLVGIVAIVAVVTVATPLGTRWLVGVVHWAAGDAVALRSPSGTLLSKLRFDTIAVPADGSQVLATDTSVEIALAALFAGELRVTEVRARAVAVTVPASGGDDPEPVSEPAWPVAPLPITVAMLDITELSVRTSERRESLAIKARLDWRGAAVSVADLDVVHADARVSGHGRIELAPAGSVTTDLAWETRGSLPAGAGRLIVGGTMTAISLEHRLAAPLQAISEGDIALAPAVVVDLEHRWQAQSLDALIGLPLAVAHGRLRTAGTIDALRFSLESGLLRPGDLSTEVRAAGVVSAAEFAIESLRLADPAGNLVVTGRVDLAAADLPGEFQLRGNVTGVPDYAVALPETLTIDNDVVVRFATATGPDGTMTFVAPRDARAGLSGVLALAGGAARLQNLRLRAGQDVFNVSGSVTPLRVDLTADWSVNELGRYQPDVGGRVLGRATLAGPAEAPAVSATAEWREFRSGEFGSATGSIQVDIDAATSGSLDARLGGVVVGGRPLGEWQVRASGDATNHRLTVASRAEGISLDIDAAGTRQATDYTLRLSQVKIEDDALGDWRLGDDPGVLVVAADTVELAPLCLVGQGSVCAQASLDRAAERGAADLDIRELPVGKALHWLAPALDVSALLNARADVRWVDGRLDGAVGVAVDNGLVRLAADSTDDGAAIEFGLTASATLADNAVAVEAALEAPSAGRWQASGQIDDVTDTTAPIRFDSEATIDDLVPLDALSDLTRIAAGSAQVSIDIAGTLDTPTASLLAKLNGLDARISATGTRLGDSALSLRGAADRGWLLDATADVGDGTLTATGELEWPAPGGISGTVAIDGADVQVADLPEIALRMSPALRLQKAADQLIIGGEIVIAQALLSPVDVPADALLPSDDVVLHDADGPQSVGPRQQTMLDLRVTLGDDVQLDGYGLQSRLAGALRLEGRVPDNWRAFGNLRLLDGSFEAYGQSLAIDQGELIFGGDPLNPGLNLYATRSVDPGVVGLRVQGTVRDPVSTLTSNPALPQAEALAWLISGRGLSAGDTAQDDLLSNAAIGLGLTRLGTVTEQLRESLGLDTLGVDGGADDGRLLAGKWIGERLYLQYAVGIFDKIGSVLVRYRINDRLRFESRTGTEQSLDLVYTVEPGRSNNE